MSPTIVFSDSVYHLAAWHNVLIIDVAGCMDLVHMKRLAREYEKLIASHPGGVLGCSFIRAGTPVSPSDARNEGARFMKRLNILRVGMVIEETGIVAQAMKTVIRGINVIARNSKLVLYRSEEEAVSGLGPLLVAGSGDCSRSAFRDAIDGMRREYEPDAARHVAL